MSEEEEQEEESMEEDEPAFFSATAPAAATVAVAAPLVQTAVETVAEVDSAELELVAAPARPKFAEMAEEPAYTPLPRDYASDFDGDLRGPVAVEDQEVQPVASLFAEGDEEAQRDLDTPTFLRRLKF